ncbi:MAG: hypothetical protein WDW38_009914 [Sanguina aurantia]
MPVIEVTSAGEFDKYVKSAKSFGGNAVIVDYSATWCGPCKMIGPVYEQLSQLPQYAGVTFLKVDVDKMKEVATAAGITVMPTFQAYYNGEMVEEMKGADRSKLTAMLNGLAARSAELSGTGRKLGSSDGPGTSSAAPVSDADTPEARRARSLAAIEARSKAAA